MSRDFEKEYRELAQMETPDLWDRIEAGLKEKPKKKTTVMMILRKYQAVAAAVFCLLLIVPALLFMKPQGVKNEAAKEEIVWEASEGETEAVPEEAAPEAPAEAMAGGADKAPAEMAADSIGIQTVPRAETEETLVTAESAEAEILNGAASKQKNDYSADVEEAELVFPNVTIKVYESTEITDVQENGETGNVYRCEVLSYKGDELKAGEMISVFVPVSSLLIEKDGSYEVDLVWRDKGNCLYQIELVYE